MTLLQVGDKAPTFSLSDQHGNTVKLEDFRGKHNVVLYFYPKAMTPGCTTQACGLRDHQAELAQQDAVVLGISPDPVARLLRFIEKKQLNFTLLSDEDHAVAEQYGAWGKKKFMGHEFLGIIRSTFIIGKDGRLLAALYKVRTKTHHDDVLKILNEQEKIDA